MDKLTHLKRFKINFFYALFGLLLCGSGVPSHAQATPQDKKKTSNSKTKATAKKPAKKKERSQPTGRSKKPLPVLPPSAPRKRVTVWGRLKKGMGKMVPKPVQQGWKNAQNKWQQTKDLYQAMKKLAGWDEATLKKKRVAEKKRLRLERWERADESAEKRILSSVRLLLWQRACQSGSSRACRKWIKVQPQAMRAFLLLRDIEWRRRRWTRVLPLCQALTKHFPKNFEHQICYANALHALGKKKKAYLLYKTLGKTFPHYGILWLTLGRIELRNKRWKQAERYCAKAVQHMPKDYEANVCLGRALELQKKLKEARKVYALACDAGDIFACQRVRDLRPSGLSGAWIWSKMNTRINAMRVARATRQNSCFIGVKRACRSEALLLRSRAQLLKKYARTREAEWLLRKSTQIASFDAETWKALGLHLLEKKQWFEGCYTIERSLQIDEKQASLWYQLGLCRARASKRAVQSTRAAYTKACALGVNKACLKIHFGRPPSRKK